MRVLFRGIFLWAIILSSVYAKWVTPADAPIKSSYTKEISINSDGTYEIIWEINKEILTELGRDAANIVLYYNGDSEKIEILAAKTIFKGKEHQLDKNLIEDKPLASSYGGFDQSRQILLAFPKTEIGATLHLKYKFIQKKSELENFFAETFYFGASELVANYRVKISSKIPLHLLVNDPENSLKITKNKSDGFTGLEITLTKPVYKDVSNEPEPIIIDDKYFTWVSISSLNKWEDFAIKCGKLFAKVFTQELPADFEQILKVAKQKSNEMEQINTVTSLLNDKIRYMGDWRTINGRYMPRDLNEISRTQLGDCKDFSAATAAILTKLGYKAQIAIVMRGVNKLSKNTLPGFVFNHAIVKVTNKQGVVYWIDPTNFVSMAGGIFPDIANKMALILDPSNPGYEKIPGVDPTRAEVILKRQLEILNDGKIIESGNVLMKNESTIELIGSALKFSDEVIKNAIFFVLADDVNLDEKNKKHMTLPKLNSRNVHDISLNYSFERENEILKTNMGSALKLTCGDSIPRVYNISQDYVSGALIKNFASTFKRQTIIKNTHVHNIEALNKEIKTPWLYVKRECKLNHSHDLQIDETIIIHKNLIPSEDFKNPEFIELKKLLKDNFKEVVIVLGIKNNL